jgi:hypothetical protein
MDRLVGGPGSRVKQVSAWPGCSRDQKVKVHCYSRRRPVVAHIKTRVVVHLKTFEKTVAVKARAFVFDSALLACRDQVQCVLDRHDKLWVGVHP